MIRSRLAALSLALVWTVGCGDDGGDDPPRVDFGEPTIVVIANPTPNDVNEALVAPPGSARSGIGVTLDSGEAATTGVDGIAVVAPVPAGDRTLAFDGAGVTGDIGLTIGATELHEVAVALDGQGATIMADVEYDFAGTLVEVTSETPAGEVAAALAMSDAIVFFRGGTYAGDLELAGSNLTIFGDGPSGGLVTLAGNVTVAGSGNRIRGAVITGSLTIEGSNAGLTFSRVLGPTSVSGSSAILLQNLFCSTITVSGSDVTALGNDGLAPLQGGCP